MPTDEQLDAAIERLTDAERFAEAERIVARAAPQLQKVLAAALAEGGWFGESHEAEALKAATAPDPEERIAAVRSLLAEEARMGMMVGVAVGWALHGELNDTENRRRRELTMEIKFHGHSCFELSEGETRVLVDPFLKPNNPVGGRERRGRRPDPHRHLPRPRRPHGRRGAGRQAHAAPSAWRSSRSPNGSRSRAWRRSTTPTSAAPSRFDWGWVKLVPAWHTSTLPGSAEALSARPRHCRSAPPAGLLINLGGITVYHAGDTCLFSDMKLIAERNPVDVALLPIGGHYTMDRHDARRRGRVRRRRHGDPDALRHLPADRDRLRRPSRPTSRRRPLRPWSCSSRASRTRLADQPGRC